MALAKTTRPRAISAVSRPRLFRLLDRAKSKPVTWVWAPPGAGKTTLVSSYLDARRIRTLWYQIDEGDDDIASFFYYLGQAAPKRKRALPLFTDDYRRGLAIFSRNYFRDLYASLKTPFALVLDNYQEARSDSPVHEVMRDALGEIPKGGHVIFLSRAEPPAALARLQSQEAIEFITGPQLRFTRTETNILAQRLTPGRRSAATLQKVYELSEGWAAGIVLLLQELRSEAADQPEHQSRSSEIFFNYFAGEIFKKADARTKEVLLQTCFLPRVTASIAEQLTGSIDAGQILAALHRQNIFTNKRPGAEPTYEYHPLFREFLLAQAFRMYSARRLKEIRCAAGRLIEAAGEAEIAAGLLLDAEDHEGLAALVCRNAPMVLAQGRRQTVEDWLAAIPETLFAENPWLLYWRGMCALGFRHADCRRDFEQALAAFRCRGDGTGSFLAWAALIYSCQVVGDARAMDPWIALLDVLMQEIAEFPSEGVETRVSLAMLTAITMRQLNHPDRSRWAERALELARKQVDVALQANAVVTWSVYYWELGNVPKAGLVVDEMRALMRAKNVPPIASITAGFGLAWHEALSALPSCRVTASYLLDMAQKSGFEPGKCGALTAGLIGALSDGDLQTAGPWLEEMRENLDEAAPRYAFFTHWMVVWEALVRGDILRAASYQPEMLRLGLSDGWPVHNLVAYLLTVQILHARGEEQEARAHMDIALELAHTTGSPFFEFMARLTEAHLNFLSGDEAEGLTVLSRAMELGRAGGFVNSFVWQPAVMAELCAKALQASIETDYVQSLIRKRKLVPKEPPVEIESWPWPIKIYTLGRVEILKDGQPLEFRGKVQRKPLALLKAVIAFGGRGVREESLIDAMWPDADGDAGKFALTSAIHRLRRLLGREEAILRQDNEISLDERHCWVDAWACERLLSRAESATRNNGHEPLREETIGVIQRAVEFYKGSFLGNDPDAPWATALADRLRRRLLRQLIQVGQHWEEREDLQEAAAAYEQGLQVDPCAEDVCRRLMNTYRQLGRPAEIVAAYRHCREALVAQLDTVPSASTETLLAHLTGV